MGPPLRIIGNNRGRPRRRAEQLLYFCCGLLLVLIAYNELGFASGGPKEDTGTTPSASPTSAGQGCIIPTGTWETSCGIHYTLEGPCWTKGGRKCLLQVVCRDGSGQGPLKPSTFEYGIGRSLVLKNINGVLCHFSDTETQCGQSGHRNLSCLGSVPLQHGYNVRGLDPDAYKKMDFPEPEVNKNWDLQAPAKQDDDWDEFNDWLKKNQDVANQNNAIGGAAAPSTVDKHESHKETGPVEMEGKDGRGLDDLVWDEERGGFRSTVGDSKAGGKQHQREPRLDEEGDDEWASEKKRPSDRSSDRRRGHRDDRKEGGGSGSHKKGHGGSHSRRDRQGWQPPSDVDKEEVVGEFGWNDQAEGKETIGSDKQRSRREHHREDEGRQKTRIDVDDDLGRDQVRKAGKLNPLDGEGIGGGNDWATDRHRDYVKGDEGLHQREPVQVGYKGDVKGDFAEGVIDENAKPHSPKKKSAVEHDEIYNQLKDLDKDEGEGMIDNGDDRFPPPKKAKRGHEDPKAQEWDEEYEEIQKPKHKNEGAKERGAEYDKLFPPRHRGEGEGEGRRWDRFDEQTRNLPSGDSSLRKQERMKRNKQNRDIIDDTDGEPPLSSKKMRASQKEYY